MIGRSLNKIGVQLYVTIQSKFIHYLRVGNIFRNGLNGTSLMYKVLSVTRFSTESFTDEKVREMSRKDEIKAKVTNPALAERILRDMVADKIPTNVVAFNSIIKAYYEVNDFVGVERILLFIKELKVYGYDAILMKYRNSSDTNNSAEILKVSENSTIIRTANAYQNEIYNFAQIPLPRRAEVLLYFLILHHGALKAEVYNIVMTSYTKISDLSSAENVFRNMLAAQVIPYAQSYEILISGYVAVNDMLSAERILIEMVEAKVEGLNKDIFFVVIKAYLNDSKLFDAERLLNVMLSHNIIATRSIFNTILKAYKNTHPEGQERILKTMQSHKITITAFNYSKLLNSYAIIADSVAAERVFLQMVESGIEVTDVTYNILLNAFVQASDPVGAERILNNMISANIKPDVTIYNTLMNAYAKIADPVGAERVFLYMAEHGIEANEVSYTTLMDAFAKASDVVGEKRIFDKMISNGSKLKLRDADLAGIALSLTRHQRSKDGR